MALGHVGRHLVGESGRLAIEDDEVVERDGGGGASLMAAGGRERNQGAKEGKRQAEPDAPAELANVDVDVDLALFRAALELVERRAERVLETFADGRARGAVVPAAGAERERERRPWRGGGQGGATHGAGAQSVTRTAWSTLLASVSGRGRGRSG